MSSATPAWITGSDPKAATAACPTQRELPGVPMWKVDARTASCRRDAGLCRLPRTARRGQHHPAGAGPPEPGRGAAAARRRRPRGGPQPALAPVRGRRADASPDADVFGSPGARRRSGPPTPEPRCASSTATSSSSRAAAGGPLPLVAADRRRGDGGPAGRRAHGESSPPACTRTRPAPPGLRQRAPQPGRNRCRWPARRQRSSRASGDGRQAAARRPGVHRAPGGAGVRTAPVGAPGGAPAELRAAAHARSAAAAPASRPARPRIGGAGRVRRHERLQTPAGRRRGGSPWWSCSWSGPRSLAACRAAAAGRPGPGGCRWTARAGARRRHAAARWTPATAAQLRPHQRAVAAGRRRPRIASPTTWTPGGRAPKCVPSTRRRAWCGAGGHRVQPGEHRPPDRAHAVQPAGAAEIEPYLAGTSEMVLEVDAARGHPLGAAQSNPTRASPKRGPGPCAAAWSASCAPTLFRERVMDATPEDAVLVIGEPEAPAGLPALDGARAEAEAVVRQLDAQLPAGRGRKTVNRKRRRIVNKLFASAPGASSTSPATARRGRTAAWSCPGHFPEAPRRWLRCARCRNWCS